MSRASSPHPDPAPTPDTIPGDRDGEVKWGEHTRRASSEDVRRGPRRSSSTANLLDQPPMMDSWWSLVAQAAVSGAAVEVRPPEPIEVDDSVRGRRGAVTNGGAIQGTSCRPAGISDAGARGSRAAASSSECTPPADYGGAADSSAQLGEPSDARARPHSLSSSSSDRTRSNSSPPPFSHARPDSRAHALILAPTP